MRRADRRDVVSLVAITLPGVPIQLVGDAIAMTAAEHRYGAAAPYQCAMCVTVSTGVGAGLIVHNQVVLGGTGNAGHLGHMVVDLDGAECVCGGRGCVEAFAGGTTMVRWAQSQGWRHPAPTVAALAADACRGDDVARDTFERAGRAIGAAVASVAALIEIQAAVIGGGVARAGELLLEPIRRHLHAYARLAFIGNVDIVPAALGGDAGLIGAALVARETDGVRVC